MTHSDSRNKSVLVGMSGGVDSSVAAALLVEAGYQVIGGFIKNWSDTKDLWTGECQWRGERRDALRVAAKLGIPLLTFDFEKQYREKIVDELFRGYAAGETPNPDVLCNEIIKFGFFLEEANRLGIDFVATGHYARISLSQVPSSLAPVEVSLLRGLDSSKDQSYFLYRLSQSVLRRTIFPIGHLHKSRVREIAKRFHLPVAEKPDSQGICFIGKIDMAEFLRKKIPAQPGDIVDETGRILGQHQGLDGFTIGQRHGILVSQGEEPWYVAEKDLENNRLLVVQGKSHPRLFHERVRITDIHWTRSEPPVMPSEIDVQVRYRQEAVKATLRMSEDGPGEIELAFHQPVKAVAAGQSAVFYQGEECLGGGVIVPTPRLGYTRDRN